MKMMSHQSFTSVMKMLFSERSGMRAFSSNDSFNPIISMFFKNDNIMKILSDDQGYLFEQICIGASTRSLAVASFFANESLMKSIPDACLFDSYYVLRLLDSSNRHVNPSYKKDDSIFAQFLDNPSVMKRINDFSILNPDHKV